MSIQPSNFNLASPELDVGVDMVVVILMTKPEGADVDASHQAHLSSAGRSTQSGTARSARSA
jgi:hypothetical protein